VVGFWDGERRSIDGKRYMQYHSCIAMPTFKIYYTHTCKLDSRNSCLLDTLKASIDRFLRQVSPPSIKTSKNQNFKFKHQALLPPFLAVPKGWQSTWTRHPADHLPKLWCIHLGLFASQPRQKEEHIDNTTQETKEKIERKKKTKKRRRSQLSFFNLVSIRSTYIIQLPR
jgi:hypothetical protein